MVFRTVLAPIIRLFQYSGLGPFPLTAKKPKSFWRSGKLRLSAITVINLSINLLAGFHQLSIFDPHPVDALVKLVLYVNLLVVFSLRIHTFSALIESFAKRSTEMKLLTTFDEIEYIFREKINLQIEKRNLLVRFRTFIMLWIVKNVVVAVLLVVGTHFAFEWNKSYYVIVIFVPFYMSTLSYTQWMVYVDVVRLNIERLNECLMKLSNDNGTDRLPRNGHIFRIEVSTLGTFDTIEQLAHLRKCFGKIWQASVLINQRFRWSLFIGNGNDLFLVVVNSYWVLYCLMNSNLEFRYDILFCSVWTIMILLNFLVISIICEDINVKVSRLFH